MTLHTLYNTIAQTLSPLYGEGEAQAIARLVLETQCQATMTDILLDRPAQDWNPHILKRLQEGEPVQYVLGEASFCGHRIMVAPGVLIPRPETEALVQEISTNGGAGSGLQGAGRGLHILDVCTGSGCIALAYKHLYPEAYVEAWDISPEALTIAERNFRLHGLDITLRQVDLLDPSTYPTAAPLVSTSQPDGGSSPKGERGGGFTHIVSNPPYVLSSERTDMEAHVLEHEPELALFVPDEDPLLFYRPLAQLAMSALLHGGTIMVECNTAYVDAVADCFRHAGLIHVTTLPDCFGLPRFVRGRK